MRAWDRTQKIAAAIYIAAIVANVVLGSRFGLYSFQLHWFVLCLLFATYMTWSVSYGHRKARRDRERAATATVVPFYANPGYLAPGTNIPGPGPVSALTNIGINVSALSAGAVTDELLVPEREDSMPFLAYKRATFEWRPGGFTMRAMYGKVELDADAVCANGTAGSGTMVIKNGCGDVLLTRGHEAPDLECNCGFHAVKRLEDLHLGYGNAVLDVELSGRVVVHEKGYRAAHQRVLRARIAGRCYVCGDPATAVAVRLDHFATPRCEVHVLPDEFLFSAADIGRRLGLPFELDAEMEFDERLEIGS